MLIEACALPGLSVFNMANSNNVRWDLVQDFTF